jgi:ribosomal protein L21E
MAKKKSKNIREKGKIRLSEYFKKIKDGQKVAVIKEKTVTKNYPERIVGLTGNVIGSQGNSKVVELMDGNKKKRFIIHPIHLKVLK